MRKIYIIYQAISQGMDFYGSSQQNKKRKWQLGKVGGAVFNVLLIAVLSFLAYTWLGDLYSGAQYDQQLLSFLTLTVLNLCGVMAFLLSFLWAMPCLFFGEDNRILLPLPITPTQLLIAKLMVLYMNMLKMIMCIGIPFFLASGLLYHMGIGYFAGAALTVLAIPAVPVALAVLLDIVIMRVFRVKINKDMISFVSTLLMIALVVVINAKSGGIGINDISQILNPKVTGFMSVLLPNINPSLMLLEGEMIGALYLLLVLLGSGGAVLLLGGKAFYTTLSSMQDSFGYKKRGKEKTYTGRRGVFAAYLDKEWKMLVRTTSNWTFIFLMGVYMPVVFAGMLLFNGQLVEQIRKVTFEGFAVTVTFWIFTGIMAYQAGLTQAGLTVVSREGKNAYVMKYLPVSMKTQLQVKLITCLSAFILPLVLVIGTFVFVARPPVMLTVHLLISGILFVLMATLAEMYYDIRFPRLNWMSENQLFNGYRMLLPLLVFLVVFALICAGLYALSLRAYTGIYVFDGILLILCGFFYKMVMREDALAHLDL